MTVATDCKLVRRKRIDGCTHKTLSEVDIELVALTTKTSLRIPPVQSARKYGTKGGKIVQSLKSVGKCVNSKMRKKKHF